MIKAITDRETGVGSIVYGDRGDVFTRCGVHGENSAILIC